MQFVHFLQASIFVLSSWLHWWLHNHGAVDLFGFQNNYHIDDISFGIARLEWNSNFQLSSSLHCIAPPFLCDCCSPRTRCCRAFQIWWQECPVKSSLLCHGGGVDQNVCWPSPCWGPSQGGSTCFVTFSQPKTFNKIYVWRCDQFEGDTNNTITCSLSVGNYRFIWNINSWICLSIYNDIFIMLMITCSDHIFEVNEVIDFNQIWTWLFCWDSIARYSKCQ